MKVENIHQPFSPAWQRLVFVFVHYTQAELLSSRPTKLTETVKFARSYVVCFDFSKVKDTSSLTMHLQALCMVYTNALCYKEVDGQSQTLR